MNSDFKVLQLKAKQQAYTMLSGHSLSKRQGEGYDFVALREYQLGDDIRKIDWMTTAKLSKPYIKEFQSYRELSVVICAFMDGSLYFGSGNDKQKKLTEVATLIGYASQYQANLFTGFCYTQKETFVSPPTKQRYPIDQFVKILYEASLLGTSLDIANSIQDVFTKITKPSLVFILGDFLQKVDLSLLAQKHEILAIILRDKEEENPQSLGEVTLSNPKNNHHIETYFGQKSIRDYQKRLKEHDEKLIQHFADNNIGYIKITTEEEAVEKLQSLFR